MGQRLEEWVDPERERLLAELADANERLTGARLELDELRSHLEALIEFHHRRLAPLYAELDEVNARVAERLADHSARPEDRELAIRARAQADRSAAEARALGNADRDDDPAPPPPPSPPRGEPSDEARQLFRRLIKLCHPDLATEADERRRREAFSRRVNDAYAEDDLPLLDQLMGEWQSGLVTSLAGGGAERLDLALMIIGARDELDQIAETMGDLAASDLGWLLDCADPVVEIEGLACQVRDEVAEARRLLADLSPSA